MGKADAKYRVTADDQTAKGLSSARRRLSLFAAGLAGVAVGALTDFRALFALIDRGLNSALQRLDKFAKIGLEIGTDAEDARELGFAADQLGGDLEKAAKVVDRFNRAIGDDSKEITDAFKTLGVDPRAFASIDDATDRLVALGSALEQLQERRGLAIRENVEQTLVGKGVSKLFAEGGRALAREVENANAAGLIDGTNEAAAAAERAGDAWERAGKIWAKLFENAGFFAAAEQAGLALGRAGQNLQDRERRQAESPGFFEGFSLLTDAIGFVRDAIRDRNVGVNETQAGGFVPQAVPDALVQSARNTRDASADLKLVAKAIKRASEFQ